VTRLTPGHADSGGTSVSKIGPGLFKATLPWLPVAIAHTRSMADNSAPLYTDGHQYPPGTWSAPAGLCGACNEHINIVTARDITWLVVEHRPDCSVLGSWEAAA
jgi:hypothetical protein